MTGAKLYCLATEAQACEQLAQGCYLKAERPGIETSDLLRRESNAVTLSGYHRCRIPEFYLVPRCFAFCAGSLSRPRTDARTACCSMAYYMRDKTIRSLNYRLGPKADGLSTCQRFYRAMLSIRGTSHGPVSVRPSVRLSVTSRSSTKTAKRRITQTTPHDSPGTLVFGCQRSPRNSTGVSPCGGAKYR